MNRLIDKLAEEGFITIVNGRLYKFTTHQLQKPSPRWWWFSLKIDAWVEAKRRLLEIEFHITKENVSLELSESLLRLYLLTGDESYIALAKRQLNLYNLNKIAETFEVRDDN